MKILLRWGIDSSKLWCIVAAEYMTVAIKHDELTEPEKRCLQAFKAAAKRLGASPLLDDIAQEMGVTKQHISGLMKGLVSKGFIERNGRYRSFKVAR